MGRGFALLAAAILGWAGPAVAQTKITLLFTAGDSFTESYVAKDQGFFAKRGLDVTLQAAQNGSVISAALEAGSAQLGAPTPTVLLQADEQGLDLVIVASANRNAKQPPISETGIAARTGSGIKDARDLEGRHVAVPGLGGTVDVTMKKWVEVHGGDYRKVDWVEFMLPRMPDALSAGLADAVAVVNPFLDRIVKSKAGYIIGDFGDIEPPGTMVVVYASTRAWAKAHEDAVTAFRAELEELESLYREPGERGRGARQHRQIHQSSAASGGCDRDPDQSRSGAEARGHPLLDRGVPRAGPDHGQSRSRESHRAVKDDRFRFDAIPALPNPRRRRASPLCPGLRHVADEQERHHRGRGRGEQERRAVIHSVGQEREDDRTERVAALARESPQAEERAAGFGRGDVGADRLDRAAGQGLQGDAEQEQRHVPGSATDAGTPMRRARPSRSSRRQSREPSCVCGRSDPSSSRR